jgi:hypothetical protein
MRRTALTMCLAVMAASAALAAAPLERDAAWVTQRVKQWQPTERERRWEGIGWAPTIREAERLAKEHNRPVFLFTLDGKMNVGRC